MLPSIASALALVMGPQGPPPLPDAHGFAGGFAGTSNGALLFAGGANFPSAPPWEGGAKVWHDRVFALEPSAAGQREHGRAAAAWREVGRLPGSRAYGASVALAEGPLCIGGSSADAHSSDVFQLVWRAGTLSVHPFPSLPEPRAHHAAARVGDLVFVACGSTSPTATAAEDDVWVLDLTELSRGWTPVDPLPAVGRILPVGGTYDGRFVVLSGAALAPDADGRAQRTYLTDAWAFTPGGGWQPLPPLPRAAVGAPSPAPQPADGALLVVGGDDGTRVGFQPLAAHPGFTRDILRLARGDTWRVAGEVPAGLPAAVTAPTVVLGGSAYCVSGEVRPGVRTREVVPLGAPAGHRAGALPMQPAPFRALDWAVVALYLSGMLAVGWWFMRRDGASSTELYFRGGQRLPAWVAGLSLFATSLSSITFMGIPARAYTTDCAWYVGQLVLLLVAPLVAYVYLPRFRGLDVTTAYELLEQRFGLGCRVFGSLSFMLFHVGRAALVLYLPALALGTVAAVPLDAAIVVVGGLCVAYTVMGGITAVAWTDAVQALVLMGGALLCFGLAVAGLEGGLAELAAVASSERKLLQNVSLTSLSVADGTTSLLVLSTAFFFNVLVPYTSSQDMVQRYVTTRDVAAARRSLWLTTAMSVLGTLVFFGLGVALFAFYRAAPERLAGAPSAADAILPFFIVHELPRGLSGLVIAALFAASQSTVSSSLNSIATCWVKDIDGRLIQPARSDRGALALARKVVLVVGGLAVGAALWMAHTGVESAFKAFNTYIGLAAGPLGGLFALAVFTRRIPGRAALCGAWLGLAGVLTVHLGAAPVTGLLYAAIGFTLCVLVAGLCTVCTPRPH